ncbi:MAG: hypothetical protein M3Q81_01960 [bacterium]|nr:hypothetical protein [bacterium]
MVTDIVPSSTTSYYEQTSLTTSPGSVTFDLFVKTHEIKQIDSTLRQITLMPKPERMDWIEDHQDLVNELLDSFLNDSALALDGLQLDDEALQLSIEFVTALRDTMNTLRSILHDAEKLTG